MSIDARDHVRADSAPRKRRPLLALLLVLLAILVVVALVAGIYLWNLGRTFDSGRQVMDDAFPQDSGRPAAGSPADRGTTVLVLGSDQQGGSGQRADTIMLLHVPEDGGEVFVMSVMRDSWVEIPGVGEAKILTTIDAGGVPLMVETLEGLFDVRIDQVAEVDFEGFEGLVDAVGGVTVDVPQDFTSWQKDMEFTEGPMHMDGEAALEFVRERRSFATGDFQRVENQRSFVQALLGKVASRETFTDPSKVRRMVSEFSPYLTVSEELDAGWVAGLAPDLARVSSGDIKMFTVPHHGIGTSPDGQSVVVPNRKAMENIGVAISGDNLDEYVATLNPEDQ